MKFLIISHAEHYKKDNTLFAYAPFVREMNLWIKHVDEVEILAPIDTDFDENINSAYDHQNLKHTEVPAFSLLGVTAILNTLFKLPGIMLKIYRAMQRADHIHLRCPGNMGLLGCLVQILFPATPKTAKYAGNWDPDAQQPWSYNLQKWLLSKTYLTKNMQVLVYGEWANQTQNITPFFTASFSTEEIEDLYIRNYTKALHFCFVGSLSPGKQPHKALELVYKLRQKGKNAVLHIYGDGELRGVLKQQIKTLKAEDWAFMYGNQPHAQIKKALKYSHFLILLSQSEGWPKAVAEAMFFGCIPIASKVSCLPWMLDHGKRGLLMSKDLSEQEIEALSKTLETPKQLEQISKKAHLWSTPYTLESFEEEVVKLLN